MPISHYMYRVILYIYISFIIHHGYDVHSNSLPRHGTTAATSGHSCGDTAPAVLERLEAAQALGATWRRRWRWLVELHEPCVWTCFLGSYDRLMMVKWLVMMVNSYDFYWLMTLFQPFFMVGDGQFLWLMLVNDSQLLGFEFMMTYRYLYLKIMANGGPAALHHG